MQKAETHNGKSSNPAILIPPPTTRPMDQKNDGRMNLNALFLPYAVAVRKNGHLFWQRNLGMYLDGLARLFQNAAILCREAGEDDPNFNRNGEPIYAFEISPSIRFLPVPRSPWRQFRLVQSAIAESDLLILFFPSYRSLLAGFLGLGMGKRLIVYIGLAWDAILPDKILPPVKNLLGRSLDYFGRILISKALFTITPGREISSFYGGEARRVHITPSTVVWDAKDIFFREDTCLKPEIRLLYVGAFRPHKGIEFLLEGFSRALAQDNRLRLTLVGAGLSEYEQSLRAQCRELKMDGVVQFAGYISDPKVLREYYQQSDIFVLPTLAEGFPRVIYEALSQGLPVIATRIPEITSMVRHTQVLKFVDPKSPSQLEDSIIAISRDSVSRREMIRSGYAFVRQHMALDASTAFFEKILRENIRSGGETL
jgi:glycosyltransferase involved in cell wall biosynthesis